MTKYQKRMTKAVWVSTAYGIAAIFSLVYYNAPFLGWLMYLSTIALIVIVFISCDAVYDSLRELDEDSRDAVYDSIQELDLGDD